MIAGWEIGAVFALLSLAAALEEMGRDVDWKSEMMKRWRALKRRGL